MNLGYLTLTLMFVGVMIAFDQIPLLFFVTVPFLALLILIRTKGQI